jgi:hypothetical protein
MGGLLALAREMGLERVLGTSRRGKLAMFLVLTRVLHQGSRLSAVRWADTQAVAETLGLSRFDEDDLYDRDFGLRQALRQIQMNHEMIQ